MCGTGDNGPQLTASVLQGTAGGGPAAFVAGQPPTAGVPAMSGWRQRPQSSQARWPPPHPPAVGSDGVCRAGALGPHLAPPLTQSASPLLHRGGCDVGAPARRRVPPSSTKRVVGGSRAAAHEPRCGVCGPSVSGQGMRGVREGAAFPKERRLLTHWGATYFPLALSKLTVQVESSRYVCRTFRCRKGDLPC